MKRDSSVRRARFHCLVGNRLGAWAVNHVIRLFRTKGFTASVEIAWSHGLLTTPYDAIDVPLSGPDKSTGGVLEDHSQAIDFKQFLVKCVDYECLRYKEQIWWQLGHDCLKLLDELAGLGVATSRVDVQTADDLLNILFPVNV